MADCGDLSPCSSAIRREDFMDFCRDLGVEPAMTGEAADSVLMVAVRNMYAGPLPPEWSQHRDAFGQGFYYDSIRGVSSWSHPQEELFKDVLREVSSWLPQDSLEEVAQRITLYMRIARAAAVRQLAVWTGPHIVPPSPEVTGAGREEAMRGDQEDTFFHNEATGESQWLDPRMSADFGLLRQHAMLSECFEAHSRKLQRQRTSADLSPADVAAGRSGLQATTSSSSSGASSPDASTSMQAPTQAATAPAKPASFLPTLLRCLGAPKEALSPSNSKPAAPQPSGRALRRPHFLEADEKPAARGDAADDDEDACSCKSFMSARSRRSVSVSSYRRERSSSKRNNDEEEKEEEEDTDVDDDRDLLRASDEDGDVSYEAGGSGSGSGSAASWRQQTPSFPACES